MEGPRELLRCAAESRRDRTRRPARAEDAAAQADLARNAREDSGAQAEPGGAREAGAADGARPAVPAHAGHAAYTALMRSHDRVRGQHLPVQGRGGGA